MPSCRTSRPSSSAVSRATTSSAEAPARSIASPCGPYRGFAYACVAIAPTCGSAHGTTEPTARNFDCTETPHCSASRSQATIEYVAIKGLVRRKLPVDTSVSIPAAIRGLDQIDLQQLSRRHEDAGYFGTGQRGQHLLLGVGAHDDRCPLVVRLPQPGVVELVEH